MADGAPPLNVLKLMSYNIQTGVQSAHNPTWDPAKIDLDAVTQVIRAENPDIVALQEVDRYRKRSGYVDQAGYLADALGMSFAYSASFYSEETEHGRGMYGNALLSRFPIERTYRHLLSRRNELQADEPQWVIEPRSMLEAAIDVNGKHLRVYATHLSTTADQQAYQIDDIITVLGHVAGPKIVMGDFNAEPTAPHMRNMFGVLRSPHDEGDSTAFRNTYPNGSEAKVAIDYIFVSDHFHVEQAYVVVEEYGVSDHNPVVAHASLTDT